MAQNCSIGTRYGAYLYHSHELWNNRKRRRATLDVIIGMWESIFSHDLEGIIIKSLAISMQIPCLIHLLKAYSHPKNLASAQERQRTIALSMCTPGDPRPATMVSGVANHGQRQSECNRVHAAGKKGGWCASVCFSQQRRSGVETSISHQSRSLTGVQHWTCMITSGCLAGVKQLSSRCLEYVVQ